MRLAKKILKLGSLFIFLVFLSSLFQRIRLQSRAYYGSNQAIFISGSGESGRASGGLVSLSSKGEPAVEISSYNYKGEAEVKLYKSDEKELLSYLVHNKDNIQVNKNPDPEPDREIASFKHQISSESEKLTLPLEETGIWILKIKTPSATETAFVIRSNFGVVVKEAGDKYLFWGQDYDSKRSVGDGTIKLYSLLDVPRIIGDGVFNQEGIAETKFNPEASVAMVYYKDSISLVPMGLRYLNSSGANYYIFQKQKRRLNYFVFTDRPIYKPGDTVYFKTILRDDDDARYSLPSGSARASVYTGYSQDKKVFFENTYSISSAGTINGQYQIPEDVKTGYYSLKVRLDDGNLGPDWQDSWEYGEGISFLVENYRKPEYNVEIEVAEDDLVVGDKLVFKIKGNYFSGQPASDQEVSYEIRSSNFYDFSFLADQLASREDNYRYSYGGEQETSGKVKLDAKGEALVEEVVGTAKEGGQRVFVVQAEIGGMFAETAFAQQNVFVHAGNFSIYRTDRTYQVAVGQEFSLPVILQPRKTGNISGVELSARINRESWISHQEEGKKYPTYTKETEQLPEQKVVTDQEGKAVFKIKPEKGGSYRFEVQGKDENGNFIAKTFSIWASEGSNYSPYNDAGSGLNLVSDQLSYDPTDTAKITISSMVPDRDVLLTVERDRVDRYQVLSLSGQKTVTSLPLLETDMPNMFLNVSSFSEENLDQNSNQISVSAKSKELTIDLIPDKRELGPGETLAVNISTTDNAGNPVSADLAFWAVDKAIFELASSSQDVFDDFWKKRYHQTSTVHSLEGIVSYGAEGGGGCFTGETQISMANGKFKAIKDVKKGDWVLTRESKNNSKLVKAKVTETYQHQADGYLIINGFLELTAEHRLMVNADWQEAGSIQIGDQIESKDGPIRVETIEWQGGLSQVYNLKIDKWQSYLADGVWAHNDKGDSRTILKDTAYWNPSVKTDSSGRAKLQFKLPDNLTTWVIMAIGSTGDTKVGRTNQEVVVSKEVIIRPILPNLARIGDEMVLSALVQNFQGFDSNFELGLNFEAGQVTHASDQEISLKEAEGKQVFWKILPDQEGEAELEFWIKSKENSKIGDSITLKLPIYQAGFWDQEVEVSDQAKRYQVDLAPDADLEKSTLSLSLSPSIFGTMPLAMEYLIQYPWGCVEQTTSSFVPAVIAKENQGLFAQAIGKKDINEIVKKGSDRLSELQSSNGSWSWWSSLEPDYFTTAYAVEYLTRARDLGFKVDTDTLRQTSSFLEREEVYDAKLARNRELNKQEKISRAYALSFLKPDRNKDLLNGWEGLDPDMLALLVMTNVRNGHRDPDVNGASRLLSLAKFDQDMAYWEKGAIGRYPSEEVSTAFAIRALISSETGQEVLPAAIKFIARQRKNHYWANTFATAQTIQALTSYSRFYKEDNPLSYVVFLGDKKIASGKMIDPLEEKKVEIPLDQVENQPVDVSIERSGQGPIYSTLTLKQFRTSDDVQAVENGLTINRKYVNQKGEEYNLGVGDLVDVEISIGGLASASYYGVIEDELPAGMIPINPRLLNQKINISNYQRGVSNREVTENGMILSLYNFNENGTYTYQARVVSEGTFYVPPARASLMYQPEIYARSKVEKIEIKDESTPQLSRLPEKKADRSGPWAKLFLLFSALALLVLVKRIKNKKKLLTVEPESIEDEKEIQE
ncbi:MAG: alpha-2-macroglobulin family protein [Patescibacteria group bacterium]